MREKKAAKKPRRRRISKEDMAARESAIIDDIRAGILSYRQIAAKHGVSLPTVNNKARKAGISRGRRKGARTLVKPVRRAGRRVVRKAARKKVVRKKAVRKVVRRRVAKVAKVATPVMRRRRKVARRPVVRKARARRARPRRAGTAKGGFSQAFRTLVLKHYPGISLVKFDKLAKAVATVVR